MKYSDLIKRASIEADVTQKEVKKSLDVIKTDDEVALNGVGKFVRKVRPARVRMNPATKERIEVPETIAISFKVSKEFRKSINEQVCQVQKN